VRNIVLFCLLPLVAHADDFTPAARTLIPLEGERRAAAIVSIFATGEIHFRAEILRQ
jgi:hypothetical protein